MLSAGQSTANGQDSVSEILQALNEDETYRENKTEILYVFALT
jgi:hypothetical protein